MKKLMMLFISLLFSATVAAEQPLLIVGASYENGVIPVNDNLQGPFGGASVGAGSYLSLGNALIRNRTLSGYVINEAQAGATTFDRTACNPVCDPNLQWQGFDKQLTKALGRVLVFDGTNFSYNAKFVLIGYSNDCLHSDAFGVPQNLTSPCTQVEFDEHADRMIALGQRVLNLGLTPVYLLPPAFNDLDLDTFRTTFGLLWTISEADFNQMYDNRATRITNEVPGAVQLKVWEHFNVLPDGIHPDGRSAEKAAQVIAQYVRQND